MKVRHEELTGEYAFDTDQTLNAVLLLRLDVNRSRIDFKKSVLRKIPIDKKLRAESLQVRGNFKRLLNKELTKYPVPEIRERFDVLLVGHSNAHLAQEDDVVESAHLLRWPPCILSRFPPM